MTKGSIFNHSCSMYISMFEQVSRNWHVDKSFASNVEAIDILEQAKHPSLIGCFPKVNLTIDS